MTADRKGRRGEVAIERSHAGRLQPIAAVATVAGVVLAAVTRLQGPGAAGALVLFCLGLAVIDGIGKQRFSLRQAVVFLTTVGAGLGAWGLAVLFLLGVVDMPTSREVRAVLIAAGACLAGAVVVGLVKLVVGRRLIDPLFARRGVRSPATGFERGSGRTGSPAGEATARAAGPSPLPGSAGARARRPRPGQPGPQG